MNYKHIIILFLASVCTAFTLAPKKYDVCVYGETVAGAGAAIQAARMGKKVVLISQTKHIGGVSASGLTATDLNRFAVVGGIAREFYQNIYAYYQKPESWKNQNRDSFFVASRKRTYTGKNDSLKMQWVYESKVAEKVLTDMLKAAGVTLIYNQKIDEKLQVAKVGTKINSIQMQNGAKYEAKMFIDASYEGDLLAKAGVSFATGREANRTYNETFNGIRLNGVIGKDGVSIDPYITPGVPSSGLLPFVDAKLWGKEGEADQRFQAFTYRVTLTNDPSNRVEIKKPANYNPLWHEVLVRRLMMSPETKLQSIITLTPMPNRKTDTNHLDFFGASFDYTGADYKTREEIAKQHQDYAIGMLWLLGNDERIPLHIRTEMKDWGFPKDEFKDNNNFPFQLYVREARRLVGDFVMTEKNVVKINREEAPNAIGMGSYALDCHMVSRVVGTDGKLYDEGSVFVATTPYPIAYQAILPKKAECSNLLVPICLSASHVAFTTIRMEPVYFVLGQSAGTAAALAIDQNTPVQDLSYQLLQKHLLEGKQILTLSK